MLMVATHMYLNDLMTLASPAGENLRMSVTLWPKRKKNLAHIEVQHTVNFGLNYAQHAKKMTNNLVNPQLFSYSGVKYTCILKILKFNQLMIYKTGD